jgi:phospholipid/cholesterol/gamma-HCH transport system permease protein
VTLAPWIEQQEEGGIAVLWMNGDWRLPNVPAIAERLRALRLEVPRPFILDGSQLNALDTAAGFVLVSHLSNLGCTAPMVTPRGFDPRHRRLLKLVHDHMASPPAEAHSEHRGLLQRVGAATARLGTLLGVHLAFIGATAIEIGGLFRRPSLFRGRETVSQFESAGIDAIPIVFLVNFLIGLVVAYVLGSQAQRYGAALLVADGIGLGMCRELAPILASIMVAGRSGAAFTAQIGTMKLTEEIDAITMLGLSPMQVLVIPRVLALVLALPLLVFVGDVAGILGGALVGMSQLDIAPGVFLRRVHAVLTTTQFAIGLVKAPVFALFIGLIACRMGILTARDARSIGNNTTSTVVQCIVWVLVLDAAFAVMFQQLGI